MAEVKTVTPREIKQITNAISDKPKTILWHGKRINVNPLLSLKEMFELVDEIMAGCIKEPEKTIVLEAVDFIFKIKTLSKYTDIMLPDDLEEQYRIIYASDLVESVFSNVNQIQLNVLRDVIRAYTGFNACI